MNYGIHKTLVIVVAALTALAMFGITASFGYGLDQPLIGGILVKHVIGALNGYVIWVMLKRF